MGARAGRDVIAALEAPIPSYVHRLMRTLGSNNAHLTDRMAPKPEQVWTWLLLGTINKAFSDSRLPLRDQGFAGQYFLEFIHERDTIDVRRIVGEISGMFIVHPVPVVVQQMANTFAGNKDASSINAATTIVNEFIAESTRRINDLSSRDRIAWS